MRKLWSSPEDKGGEGTSIGELGVDDEQSTTAVEEGGANGGASEPYKEEEAGACARSLGEERVA
jgi:hypothetical protein